MFAEHTTGNDLSFVILSYRESNREGVSSRWIDFHLTSIFPFCILVYSHSFFSEPKADAQVRVERHGGSLHRGDDDGDHDAEEQPGVAAGAAGQQERQLYTHQEDEVDGGTEVRLILILLAATLIVSMAYNFDFGVLRWKRWKCKCTFNWNRNGISSFQFICCQDFSSPALGAKYKFQNPKRPDR